MNLSGQADNWGNEVWQRLVEENQNRTCEPSLTANKWDTDIHT